MSIIYHNLAVTALILSNAGFNEGITIFFHYIIASHSRWPTVPSPRNADGWRVNIVEIVLTVIFIDMFTLIAPFVYDIFSGRRDAACKPFSYFILIIFRSITQQLERELIIAHFDGRRAISNDRYCRSASINYQSFTLDDRYLFRWDTGCLLITPGFA